MCSSHTMRRLIRICLLLFPLSVLASGCGSKDGTVSGTVYYKGQPIKGGTVYFFPEKESGSHLALIGTDGTYSISKLPMGPAKISVMVAVPGVPKSVFSQGKFGGGQAAEKGLKGRMTEEAKKEIEEQAKPSNITGYSAPIPEKYSNPERSGLKIDVTGGNQTHDIKMD